MIVVVIITAYYYVMTDDDNNNSSYNVSKVSQLLSNMATTCNLLAVTSLFSFTLAPLPNRTCVMTLRSHRYPRLNRLLNDVPNTRIFKAKHFSISAGPSMAGVFLVFSH